MRTFSVSRALKISASTIVTRLHTNPPMLALQTLSPVVKEKPSLSLAEWMVTSKGGGVSLRKEAVLESAIIGAGQFLEAGLRCEPLTSAVC